MRTRVRLRSLLSRSAAVAALLASLLTPAAGVLPTRGSPGVASFATWWVGPGGGGGACGIPDFDTDVYGERGAINAAILSAYDGDVITLCQNVYDLDGSIVVDADLTIVGESSTNTIIDGGGTQQLFALVSDGGPVVLRDLELRDGSATQGGAIVANNVRLGVERVRFVDNVAPGGGGAIFAQGPSFSVTDSTFIGNSSEYGGAISTGAEVTLLRTSFIGNYASNFAGAVLAIGGTVTGGQFIDNTSGNYGAGAIASPGADLRISGTRFERNRSLNSLGGAISVNSAALSISDATFIGNAADTYGGAISSYDVSIVRSQFTDNTAGMGGGSASGGAVFATGSISVSRSSFIRNRTMAGDGGGLWATGPITAANGTFIGNRAESGMGGAIRGSVVEVTSATFAWNTAPSNLDSAHVVGTIASRDSLWVGAACSNVPHVESGTNLSTDPTCPGGTNAVTEADLRLDDEPKLNGGTTLSLALLQGSVAIDATGGTCGTATDQPGTTRPQLNGCDIGAFEYTGSLGSVAIATQVSAGGIDIVGGVPEITTDDLVSDEAIVTGTVTDPQGGTFDPTGSIVFRYCRDTVAPPTACTDASWTTISGGTVSLTSGDDASDGISVARLVDWSPPQGGYYLLAASYVPGAGGVYDAADHTDTATEAFHALAIVTLAYAGPYLAITDGTTRATLTASASPASVAEGCPVTFRVEPSGGTAPLTGIVADGVATASLDLSGGVYTITLSIGGDCSGGTEVGVLVVGTAGAKGATGGGWYKVPGFSPPKAHFGFTVQVQRRGLDTVTKGQLLWTAKGGGGWRLKASIPQTDGTVWVTAACPPGVGDASSRSNPVCGTFGGTGLLQRWDAEAEDWTAYTTVDFRVTVYDGGSVGLCRGRSGKHCTSQDVADWFGISLSLPDGTPITALDGVPVSAPIRLTTPDGRGSIRAL